MTERSIAATSENALLKHSSLRRIAARTRARLERVRLRQRESGDVELSLYVRNPDQTDGAHNFYSKAPNSRPVFRRYEVGT